MASRPPPGQGRFGKVLFDTKGLAMMNERRPPARSNARTQRFVYLSWGTNHFANFSRALRSFAASTRRTSFQAGRFGGERTSKASCYVKSNAVGPHSLHVPYHYDHVGRNLHPNLDDEEPPDVALVINDDVLARVDGPFRYLVGPRRSKRLATSLAQRGPAFPGRDRSWSSWDWTFSPR